MDGLTERGQAMGGLPVTGPALGWELRALFDALGEVAARQQSTGETLKRIEEVVMAAQDDINTATDAMNNAAAAINAAVVAIGAEQPVDTSGLAAAAGNLNTAAQSLTTAVTPAPPADQGAA